MTTETDELKHAVWAFCDLRTLHDAALVAADGTTQIYEDVQLAWGDAICKPGMVRVRSTDSHVGYERFVAADGSSEAGELLIPRQLILEFCKLAPKGLWDVQGAVHIRLGISGVTLTFMDRRLELTGEQSNRKFPDFDSILPEKYSIALSEPIAFDPRYLRLLGKINREHVFGSGSGCGGARLLHAGEADRAVIWEIWHSSGSHVRLIICPLRPTSVAEAFGGSDGN